MKAENRKVILLFVMIVSFSVGACDKTDQMIQAANEYVEVTNAELFEANRKYLEEVDIFREVTSKKFAANDSTMICFKSDLEKENKSGNSYYQKVIVNLEQENQDLKMRIDNYQPVDAPGWKNFQIVFNNDLRILEEAYKNLGVRSTQQLVET